MFRPILIHYLDSPSMLQKFLTAIITEEWAQEHDAQAAPGTALLIETSPLAKDLSDRTLAFLQAEPPAAYHEMAYTLSRIHNECYNLLQAFVYDCKLPQAAIPVLGTEIDPTETRPGCFTITTAQAAVGDMFTKLKDALGRTKKKELAIIKEKRNQIAVNIDRYVEVKAQYDVRICAAFAAAYVALKATPDKVSPIVKGIMNGIKVCANASDDDGVTDVLSPCRAKKICSFRLALLSQSPPLWSSVYNGICRSHPIRL